MPNTSSPGETASPSGGSPPRSTAAGTEFQGGKDGQFGFIEAEDDEVFEALLGTAEDWSASGRERLLGPMDFTTNDEWGS